MIELMSNDSSTRPPLDPIKTAKQAADMLSETMTMAGYLPNGPLDHGLPKQHVEIEKQFRNILEFLKKFSS